MRVPLKHLRHHITPLSLLLDCLGVTLQRHRSRVQQRAYLRTVPVLVPVPQLDGHVIGRTAQPYNRDPHSIRAVATPPPVKQVATYVYVQTCKQWS